MKIGVDLDGVVYDFTGSFINYLDVIGYPDAPGLPYPDRWNTWECWAMDMDVWKGCFRDGVESGYIFRTGAPIAGAKEALEFLKEAGHTIHIVTHRDIHPRAIQSTVEWLTEHEIPYDTLTFSPDKTVVPVDVFIEDNVDNWRAVYNEGVEAYLFTQPWNLSWKGEKVDTEFRVATWPEFVTAVERKQEREDFKAAAAARCGKPLFATETVMGQKVEVDSDGIFRFNFPTGGIVNPPNPSGEVRVTSKTGGEKGSKPARYDLIPAGPLNHLALMYGKGAEKYADRNWERGYEWSLSFAAMQRHSWQFWSGEDFDSETLLPHLASVAFHAFALLEFMDTAREFDNRPSTLKSFAAEEALFE